MLTPDEMYDKDKTREALKACGNTVVGQASSRLIDRKLIIRISNDRERHAPGRNFRTAEKYVPVSLAPNE